MKSSEKPPRFDITLEMHDFMPLLKQEQDIYPENLFETLDVLPSDEGMRWWAMQTLPRCEKKLMRQLIDSQVPHYGPVIQRRYRSPQGRMRTSFVPLFSNYVFVFGDDVMRYKAFSTGSVSKCMKVVETEQFVEDITRIYRAIQTGEPVFPETKLEPGDPVRVKSGPFKGFEGKVIRREHEIRLLISVRCMGQGISVQILDCQVDAI
jgi:transcription antitermination factor NusG